MKRQSRIGGLTGGALLALSALALGGCHPYEVHVNGFSDPAATFGKSYVIMSAIKDTAENDLQFIEAARYLERALAPQGYTRLADPQTADIGILLFYAMGNPETRFANYSSPIWGQIGGGAVSTSTAGGVTTTYYTPSYGVVGFAQNVQAYTAFTKSLAVTAVDLREYREKKLAREFWKTLAYCTTTSQDLRRAIPVLIAGAAPFFGTDTGKAVRVTLFDDSPAVLALTGGAPP